jgi:methyl-accepting chemotaxis protein
MNDTPGKPVFHQRRYLVDKRFQMKYTLMVVAFSTVLFWVLGYLLYQKTRANTEILGIQNPDLLALVSGQDLHVLYLLFGFFVLQVASLFVLGILITHRIAGPVHRVQRYLEEAAETGQMGPLSPVRNQDEFQEFFESLSRLMEKARGDRSAQRKKVEDLRAALDRGDLDRSKALAAELLSVL